MRKKKWTTLKLIVLVKGNPNEMILQNCKGAFGTGSDVAAGCGVCMISPACAVQCNLLADS